MITYSKCLSRSGAGRSWSRYYPLANRSTGICNSSDWRVLIAKRLSAGAPQSAKNICYRRSVRLHLVTSVGLVRKAFAQSLYTSTCFGSGGVQGSINDLLGRDPGPTENSLSVRAGVAAKRRRIGQEKNSRSSRGSRRVGTCRIQRIPLPSVRRRGAWSN